MLEGKDVAPPGVENSEAEDWMVGSLILRSALEEQRI